AAFGLSIGLERFGNGTFPTDKDLRRAGHDIKELIKKAQLIPRTQSAHSTLPSDSITDHIIEFLSEFAECHTASVKPRLSQGGTKELIKWNVGVHHIVLNRILLSVVWWLKKRWLTSATLWRRRFTSLNLIQSSEDSHSGRRNDAATWMF